MGSDHNMILLLDHLDVVRGIRQGRLIKQKIVLSCNGQVMLWGRAKNYLRQYHQTPELGLDMLLTRTWHLYTNRERKYPLSLPPHTFQLQSLPDELLLARSGFHITMTTTFYFISLMLSSLSLLSRASLFLHKVYHKVC